MVTVSVAYVALIVVIFSFLFQKIWKSQETGVKSPPLYCGWLPWIGCALELGKEPIQFIEKKRKEMGPVFTIQAAENVLRSFRILKIFPSFSIPPVWISTKLWTRPCKECRVCLRKPTPSINPTLQKRLVTKVAGKAASTHYSSLVEGFKARMDELKVRSVEFDSLLAISSVEFDSLLAIASVEFDSLLAIASVEFDSFLCTGDYELMDIVRSIMYPTVLDALYGKGKLHTMDQAKFKELQRHFVAYDNQFDYGSTIPGFFLRQWSKSRSWLLQECRDLMESDRKNEGKPKTVNQFVLDGVDAEDIHSFSLVVMWAALANATPATFWTLALLLTDERVLQKARSEVAAVLGATDEVSEETVESMTYLRHCIMEALRLCAPGIVFRRVMTPLKIKDFTVPVGDLLAISPFWAHRNPEIYPDPEQFLPERWETTAEEKKLLLELFIPFGAGRWQCPGKRLTFLEMQLFLALFLPHFDCKLKNPVPKMSPMRMAGVVHPETPCPVHLKKL